MKIELELTEKELKLITEWLACQDVEDTDRIIEEYALNMNRYEAENALYKLYDKLNEVSKSVNL